MPAAQFFAMFDAARAIRSQERVLECWQARSANVSKEGFFEILEFFNSLSGKPAVRPPDVKLPALKGEAARKAVMHAFGRDPRSAVARKRPVKH